MTQYKHIGIDISKAVFTANGVGERERPPLQLGQAFVDNAISRLMQLRFVATPVGG
jgi:hypothetical protein